ncbi:MAG: response regulator [Methyloprofundus sp.]|nr:response regulator [Methyloprofundus sp.]
MNTVAKQSKRKLLLIDDASNNIELLFDMLSDDYEIFFATEGHKGIALAKSKQPDLILLDIVMPVLDGFAVCQQLKTAPETAQIPVIFLTAESSVETIIKGFSMGVVDYVTKPFNAAELNARVQTQIRLQIQQQALQQQNQELQALNQQLQQEITHRQQVEIALQDADQKISVLSSREAKRWKLEAFVGHSPCFLELIEQIRRLQKFDKTSVLILGESGTGKELVARAIHYGSLRMQGPFITVNCSAIPTELADSAFFGHIKGAFTGAQATHKGYFEAADGGTLFLDELGDMPLMMQTKLLRVLEDRKVIRVGSTTEKSVDVRVIAATNSHLEQRIQDKSFRQDLYHRLTGYTIHLPPLRKRREDITLLVEHFLQLLAEEMSLVQGFISTDALQTLKQYSFPGNIRELRNIIEHALISSNGQPIQAQHLHLIQPNEVLPKVEASSEPPVTAVVSEQPMNIHNSPTMENEQKIIQYLQEFSQINNIECQQLLNINHHQASYLLKKMNKAQQLIRKGERRWAFYCLA